MIGTSILYHSLSENYKPDTLSNNENANSEEPELKLAPDFTVYDLEGNEVHLSDYFGKPIIVNFWASWCGPCKMIGPIIDQIADERTDVKVCKINVDDEPELAAKFRVMSIPTLIVFKDGQVATQSMGAKPKAEILALLD